MEATKERKEQVKKGEKQKSDDKDPMGKAREIIGEVIISKSAYGGAVYLGDEKKGAANEPEDVLAYSRAVRHTDSSLE